MMLFDSEGKIRRYESPEAILEEFAILRLEYYHKRKLSLLAVRSLPLTYITCEIIAPRVVLIVVFPSLMDFIISI